MKKFILLSALSIILFSCQKTEKENPQPVTPPTNTGTSGSTGNTGNTNNTPVDTIYRIKERVTGFTTANYSFPPSTTTYPLPSSLHVSSNVYDWSGYTIITNGPNGLPLKKGDVIKLFGSTSYDNGYQSSTGWGFDIILLKLVLVNGVETQVSGQFLTYTLYSDGYVQSKSHTYTI